jgi:hypothetical protein
MLVMKLAFLVSALLFAYVAIKVPTQPQPSPSPAVEWTITTFAIIDDLIGLNGRRFYLWIAKRASENSLAATPLGRWMTANVMSLAFMESCILFGMVLHFIGANLRLVQLLFVVGILSLLFWSPGTPPTASEGIQLRS